MSALGVSMAHLPGEGFHGLNGIKKPALTFNGQIAGPSAEDIELLVRLLGQQGFIHVASICQRYPAGFGLQMVGDDILCALCNEFEIVLDTQWEGQVSAPFSAKQEIVKKFQQRCKLFLTSLEDSVVPEKSIISKAKEEQNSINSHVYNKDALLSGYKRSNPGLDVMQCHRCKLAQGNTMRLSKCSLSCGKLFHEESCKGRELVPTLGNGLKVLLCQTCASLWALIRCIPDILDSENRSLYFRMVLYLNAMLTPTFGGLPGFNIPGPVNMSPHLSKYQAYELAARQKQILMNQHFMQAYAPVLNCSFNSLLAANLAAQTSQTLFPPINTQEQGSEEAEFEQESLLHGKKPKAAGPKTKRLKKSASSPAKTDDSTSRKKDPTLSPIEKSIMWEDEPGSKQKRTRWLGSELHNLWKGISIHGNRWYEVKNALPGRTYYQVKDKGRRLLYNQGWRTGRLKTDNDGAYEDAKSIARLVLTEGPKRKSKAPNLGEKRKTM